MVLDNDKIKQLLEKYNQGETTLEEEAQLKSFFLNEKVPQNLQPYSSLFTYFADNKKEAFAKSLKFKPKQQKSRVYKWLAVAAVVVLMLGIFFKTPLQNNYNSYVYGTYSKPEQALEQVTKSLAMISNHFNKGIVAVGYLNEYQKGAETLNYINELETATHIIFKPNN